MHSLAKLLLVLNTAAVCLTGCQSSKPVTEAPVNPRGWVLVASVPQVNLKKVQRAMTQAQIPTWYDDERSYPYYRVRVPSEYRQTAKNVLTELGQNVVPW